MNKTVYIIVPVYNTDKFLRKCLDTIFGQTYKNIKLICINDGSTDNSLSILKEYEFNYKNMILINQSNQGVSSARNAGLDFIDYDEDAYLTFVDADDWVELDYIENLVNMLESHSVDLVCSSFFFAKENSKKTYKHIDTDCVLNNIVATELLIKDETIQSHSFSCLFKLKMWKDKRYSTDLFYMEDQAIIFKLFYESNKVFITNYSGYYYRQDNVMAATKNGVSVKKVVSGLNGYYEVCRYKFKDADKEILINAANNALACAFLMLIPYYKKNQAIDIEKRSIKRIKSYINNNHVIQKYKTNNKNNKIKKRLYLLCPAIYPFMFFVAKKFAGR